MAGKILVLGATGNVGTQLVAALVAKGEQVKAATRRGTAVAGAEAVAFDMENPSNLADVLGGVDRIYLMVPGGNLKIKELTMPVIEAAVQRNIKVVLQSVFGVDADDTIPIRQVELALVASGVKHVILRPTWFSDNFHGYWIHGIQQGTIALPAADGKSSFIDARDIAASAAAALTSVQFDGQAFNLTGPAALGYADAAAIISKISGRNVTYTAIDDATFVANLVGAGVPSDYAHFLAMIFAPVRAGWTAKVTHDVEKLTGQPPRTVETYVKDHVKAFAL